VAGQALEAVRSVAQRVTDSRGFELVDVELKRQREGMLVRLYVDKEGGIGLDDLQSVSEEVSAILDAEDPIRSSYTLEVSSPGLDRPLHTEADYRRFAGKLAKLSSYEPVDGRRHWTGRLAGVEDGVVSIVLENEGGRTAQVPFAKLSAGRLEVEFGKKAT
jgi:ribosome maturation factor RimP